MEDETLHKIMRTYYQEEITKILDRACVFFKLNPKQVVYTEYNLPFPKEGNFLLFISVFQEIAKEEKYHFSVVAKSYHYWFKHVYAVAIDVDPIGKHLPSKF